jgi:hypothetical protein
MDYWWKKRSKYKEQERKEKRDVKKAEKREQNRKKRILKEKALEERDRKEKTGQKQAPRPKQSGEPSRISPPKPSQAAGKGRTYIAYSSPTTGYSGYRTQYELNLLAGENLEDFKNGKTPVGKKALVKNVEDFVCKINDLKEKFKDTSWVHPYDKSDTAVSINSMIEYSHKYLNHLNVINKLGVEVKIPRRLDRYSCM